MRAILKRESVDTAIFATYTPPRNVSVYSSASCSCKNVEVLLPHARRQRRGSEIYLHTRVELSYYDQTVCLLLSKKAQTRVEAKRSGYFSVYLPFTSPCYAMVLSRITKIVEFLAICACGENFIFARKYPFSQSGSHMVGFRVHGHNSVNYLNRIMKISYNYTVIYCNALHFIKSKSNVNDSLFNSINDSLFNYIQHQHQ